MNFFVARRRRATADRRKGQALVEFALVLPIFLLIAVALFDVGRAVFAWNTLTNATREGARIAIVNQDSAKIVERAKSQTRIVELEVPNVTVSFYQTASNGTADTSKPCSPVAVGCLAVVGFEATYRPITPIIANFLFKNGVTFKSTSVLSVEYSCPNATRTAAQCPKQP